MADKNGVKKFQMTLNLDSYEKLKVVAEKNKRSVVRQVEYWIEQNLEKYENEHGKISLVQNNNLFANAEINLSGV